MNSVIPAIRDELIKQIISQVMARLTAWSIVFASPLINPLTLFIVTKLVTYLVDETALGLSLLWISLNVSYEVDSVDSAVAALKDMIDNPKGYSDAQAKQIEASFDDAARDLIKLSIIKLR